MYNKNKMTMIKTEAVKFVVKTTIAFVIGMSFYPSTASAAEVTQRNFDYVLYADMYPDCKQAFGYNKNALYKHYINNGMAEGRAAMGSRVGYVTEKSFDYQRYATDYPEVAAVVGTSRKALYNHYIHNGVREGKIAWSTNRDLNIQMRAFDVTSSVTNSSMSDREKIRAVHDWIVRNTAYNMNSYTTKNYLPTDHEADGPLVCGTAVCAGYARAFKACMRELGIECRYVSSGTHAWNEVFISDNGQPARWLSIDTCWDDPVPDRAGEVWRYEYFLITPEAMAQVEHHRRIVSYE